MTLGARALSLLESRMFEHVRADAAWPPSMRAAEAKGPLVYVMRSASLVDYLALTHLVQKHDLRRVGFVNTLAWPPRPTEALADELARTMRTGDSALLFLRQPPSLFRRLSGVPSEGDELLRAVLTEGRRRGAGADITMVPLVFLWSLAAERRGFHWSDMLFGPTDMPGNLRSIAQFVARRNASLRFGEPLGVHEFLRESGREGAPIEDADIRRLTYALVRMVERERRSVLGPARKAPDRVRQEVLRSRKLRNVMEDMARHGDHDIEDLVTRAEKMLRELSAEPTPAVYDTLEPVAKALHERLFSSVDVDVDGIARVREAAKKGVVVYLPSHKSHVDYLLLAYVFRTHLLEQPMVAAGDNLAFFPIGPLLRRSGAFFIRRSFKGDKLYAAVVDAYVRRLIRDGWALEFFLEGGRSRTGKLLPPQVGLLNLVVDAALSHEERTISFVPISIGYERTMEDVELSREKAGAPKEKESFESLFAIGEALGEKYGRINVQFGAIVELAELRRKIAPPDVTLSPARRRALVADLARRVMAEIQRVTAITAGGLVATVLLDMAGRGLGHAELARQTRFLFAAARREGARAVPGLVTEAPEGGETLRESAIREATLLFARNGLLREHVPDDTLVRRSRALSLVSLFRRRSPSPRQDVVYTVPDEARARLDLVKNGILHFFAARSVVARAFLSHRTRAMQRAVLEARATELAELFENGLIYLGNHEGFVSRTIDEMIAERELALAGDDVVVGPGDAEVEALEALSIHASHLTTYVEAYRVTARAARVLAFGRLAEKELKKRALAIGEQMFLGGEIDRREALSRPLFDEAVQGFIASGILKRSGDDLELTPAFATEERVRALEARIDSFSLRGRR